MSSIILEGTDTAHRPLNTAGHLSTKGTITIRAENNIYLISTLTLSVPLSVSALCSWNVSPVEAGAVVIHQGHISQADHPHIPAAVCVG